MLIQELDSVFGVVKPGGGAFVPVDQVDLPQLQRLWGLSRPFEFDEHVAAERADKEPVGDSPFSGAGEFEGEPSMSCGVGGDLFFDGGLTFETDHFV